MACVQAAASFVKICCGGDFCPDKSPGFASQGLESSCCINAFPNLPSRILSSMLIPNIHLHLGLELTPSCLLSRLILNSCYGYLLLGQCLRQSMAVLKSSHYLLCNAFSFGEAWRLLLSQNILFPWKYIEMKGIYWRGEKKGQETVSNQVCLKCINIGVFHTLTFIWGTGYQ